VQKPDIILIESGFLYTRNYSFVFCRKSKNSYCFLFANFQFSHNFGMQNICWNSFSQLQHRIFIKLFPVVNELEKQKRRYSMSENTTNFLFSGKVYCGLCNWKYRAKRNIIKKYIFVQSTPLENTEAVNDIRLMNNTLHY